jgi:peptidyl-prolyl cis-trans isomerase C
VIAELDKGADFAELAKSKSTGPSGPRGGDLGFFGKGRMVPAFEAAAFALDKGAYTKEPVQSQFGWHVIRKDDEREQAFPGI